MMSGKYLHMRCVAHIVNLIVGVGLEEIGLSTRRVREAVRWVVASPSREQSFHKIAVFKKINSNRKLCLDVPSRWNSTYPTSCSTPQLYLSRHSNCMSWRNTHSRRNLRGKV
ncbi:Zinc finger BED domain-containing protein RICESLEEPER 2 [Linum perenne]